MLVATYSFSNFFADMNGKGTNSLVFDEFLLNVNIYPVQKNTFCNVPVRGKSSGVVSHLNYVFAINPSMHNVYKVVPHSEKKESSSVA